MKIIDKVTNEQLIDRDTEKGLLEKDFCPSDFMLPDHINSRDEDGKMRIVEYYPSKNAYGCGGMTCKECWNREYEGKQN